MPRIALVTGANRGIGLEFVRQLLARGDRVIAACRHPGRATALNALGGEHPGRLHVLPLDVASEKSRAELARELPLVLGEDERIGLLVNNAGVLHSGERFGQLRQETLEDSLRVNAVGPLLLAQALAPFMQDGTCIAEGAGEAINQASIGERLDRLPGALGDAFWPVVANLSSQLGSIAGIHRFGTPGYAISKAAQNMATAQLAQALAARGIVVLALHPGWVQTDMGGGNAPDAPADVVAGMLRVIDKATPEQSGGFFDWRGEALLW
ncbi:SDR family oxidoreductase [Thermomonas brevis]|uniref:SDR family oxidoreductase n=1 Tax=Thermomonas brevis TaxID=215691 RepID=A0A7G9QQ92_9GAMM|nr:SDR family oxidoreductase [Thermomonas brevis]QNN45517.1 SDR family oxidoreductase [Thermomonas brevis]